MWKLLAEKGKFATIIGFILAVVATVVMSILLIKDQDYKYVPFIITFSISIVFFILPSSFKVKFKDFEIEIKD